MQGILMYITSLINKLKYLLRHLRIGLKLKSLRKGMIGHERSLVSQIGQQSNNQNFNYNLPSEGTGCVSVKHIILALS